MFDYSDLREASWRGISVPVIQIQHQLSQDLAQHKKVDRDGARVEGTGLNPSNFTLKIPFINTMLRAKNETWSDLFPARHIQFLNAFKDRSTGILVHPLYGEFKCKPSTWSESLSGDQRDGVIVDVSFIATTEDNEVVASTVNSFSSAKQSAKNLDQGFSSIKKPSSFSDFVDSLTAVFDSASSAKEKFIAKIDAQIAALNNISKLVKRTDRVFSTDPVTKVETDLGFLDNGIVNFYNNATQLSLSLINLKQSIIAKDREISTYIVPKEVALTSIAIKLRNSVKEILELNTSLPRVLVVPRYTVIRYYQK